MEPGNGKGEKERDEKNFYEYNYDRNEGQESTKSDQGGDI